MGKRIFAIVVLMFVVMPLVFLNFKTDLYAMEDSASNDVSIFQNDMTFEASEVLDIPEDEVPMGTLSKHSQAIWWWLPIVIVIGAAGAEIISRRQLNKNRKKDEYSEPTRLI